jgi:hypothetical protein
MSNDRHTPDDMARAMASAAAREPLPRETRHDSVPIEDREHSHIDDRGHIDDRRHVDTRETAGSSSQMANDRPMAMFAGAEAAGYRTQWDAIQTGFVDEPRRAVQEADALVALVMKRLSEVFGNERSSLERQWGEGEEISTEDLRVALRRYRSFFERLLSL